MILLRANSEIRAVFLKMIKTMGEDIAWTEIFMITNNDIILVGKEKSLFFNFDNKSNYSNHIDISIEASKVEQIIKGTLLENTLNMLLYAFGKWGGIKGLTVEMDYEQLNKLLNKVLSEVDIKISLTQEYFRFYKEGLTFTYEDVIQAILDQTKGEDEDLDDNKDNADAQPVELSKDSIGLWHKIQWESGSYVFEKQALTEEDKRKSRIGHNFYRVGYGCPSCKEKLHMVVYPEGSEYRIETDEEAVYLARAYACNQCNSYYTPKPNMLLQEGEAYSLNFEEDKVAYLDYLDLLGENGARTFNGHFNQYESEYLKSDKQEDNTSLYLEELMANIQTISDQDMMEIKEKMDEGFYPIMQVRRYRKAVNKEIRRRMRDRSNGYISSSPDGIDQLTRAFSVKKPVRNHIKGIKVVNPNLHRHIIKDVITNGKTMSMGNGSVVNSNIVNGSIVNNSTINTTAKLQEAQSSKVIKEPRVIDCARILESAKDKSYTEISRLISKIKTDPESNIGKKEVLEELDYILYKKGDGEVKNLMLSIPNEVSAQQYHLYKDKIEQYKKIDTSSYISVLKQKRDNTEKQEIASFIKKQNPVNRTTYFETYQKLKEQGFDEGNVKGYLDKIYDKIEEYDRRAIRKTCPEPGKVTFQEGLQAYEEISQGDYLPELKANVLALLDKRLSGIKLDECELLVNKLRKKMNWSEEDYSRIHLYDVRKNNIIIQNALNTYASARGRYEYPIIICDDSHKGNGKTGYILTPDHIYYNSLTSSGYIKIEDIANITLGKGIFKNKIYAQHKKENTIKISNNLRIKQLKTWVNVLNEYLQYLQEKPESRDISYLAKEKHEVICCYRCGFTYRKGNICPRCGSRYQ